MLSLLVVFSAVFLCIVVFGLLCLLVVDDGVILDLVVVVLFAMVIL